jgi:hypothetical protein
VWLLKRTWQRLRKNIYQFRHRIEHRNNGDGAQTEADHTAEAIAEISKIIAQANQTGAYQKREYRLNLRRYIRERRENRCRKRIEVATLIVVTFYAAVTLYLAGVAHDQLLYSERPWVALGQIAIIQQLSEGRPMVMNAPEQNGGKSPALYANAWALLLPQFEASTRLQPFIPAFPDRCSKPKPKWSTNLEGGIILPGIVESLRVTSQILPTWIINAVTKQGAVVPVPLPTPLPQFFVMPKGADPHYLRMSLTGCIEYFDEFHKAHRTTFCEIYMPGSEATGPCAVGNYAD